MTTTTTVRGGGGTTDVGAIATQSTPETKTKDLRASLKQGLGTVGDASVKTDTFVGSGDPLPHGPGIRQTSRFERPNVATHLERFGNDVVIPGEATIKMPKNVAVSSHTAGYLQQLRHDDPQMFAAMEKAFKSLSSSSEHTFLLTERNKVDGMSLNNLTREQLDALARDVEAGRAQVLSGGEWKNVPIGMTFVERTTTTTVGATEGNGARVAELNQKITAWNERYSHSFSFDNDVGNRVQNEPQARAAAQELAGLLNDYKDVLNGATVAIGGHTSTVASAEYNQALSEQRAGLINDFLQEAVAKFPDLAQRSVSFQAIGYGETRPLEANDAGSEALQQKNRRVEATLIPDPRILEGTTGVTVTTKTYDVVLLTAGETNFGGRPEEKHRKPGMGMAPECRKMMRKYLSH